MGRGALGGCNAALPRSHPLSLSVTGALMKEKTQRKMCDQQRSRENRIAAPPPDERLSSRRRVCVFIDVLHGPLRFSHENGACVRERVHCLFSVVFP